MDILEFLGIEEQNLLTSLMKLRDELDFLNQFDALFQLLMRDFSNASKAESDIPIFVLITFVHTHLYISVICLLRLRLSEGFSSTRAAIDATLTIYKITSEPNTVTDYLRGGRDFRNIKGSIKKIRKKDTARYPLAKDLIEAHEVCSGYGPHADFKVFFNRLQTKKTHDGNVEIKEANVGYFQCPEDDEEIHKFFLWTLQFYDQMFKVILDCAIRRVDLNPVEFATSISYLERDFEGLKNNLIKPDEGSRKPSSIDLQDDS